MIDYLEEIKYTLENPETITDYSVDEDVRYYFKYIKHRKGPHKNLMITVKYLNGAGFVITAYFK